MLSFSPADLISRILILLIVFPAHELAHAVAATRFGDPTPRAAGRLTLNPFKHLNLVGSLMFVLMGVGWASTPVNPANFGERRRLKMGIVSLAGPLANLVLAFLGAVPFHLFRWNAALASANPNIPDPAYFFTLFVFLNLLLLVFNLVPIAPLDGAAVLGALMPGEASEGYDAIQRFGPYLLMAIVFFLPFLGFNPLIVLLQYFVYPFLRLLVPGIA